MSKTSDLNSLHRITAPGPKDPICMLRACHPRMLEHCVLLDRLLQHLEHQGGGHLPSRGRPERRPASHQDAIRLFDQRRQCTTILSDHASAVLPDP